MARLAAAEAHRLLSARLQLQRVPARRASRKALRSRNESNDNADPSFFFDSALSFAGEDRSTAEAIVGALQKHAISVFYDRFYQADLVGRDLSLRRSAEVTHYGVHTIMGLMLSPRLC